MPVHCYNQWPSVLVYLNPILILVGWGVIAVNANRIARRSETRGLVDKITRQIRRLESLTLEAWFDSHGPVIMPLVLERVTSQISLVEGHLNLLSHRKIEINTLDISNIIFKLRDDLTLDIEKKENLNPQQQRTKQSKIARECRRLIIDLENRYASEYY